MDAVDYDGDGDLDLVVGGYSMWKPKGRPLSDEEQATVARLREEQAAVQSQRSKHAAKIQAEVEEATAGMERKEARVARSATDAKYRDRTSTLAKEHQALAKQLNELVPAPKRKSFVWLYERQ